MSGILSLMLSLAPTPAAPPETYTVDPSPGMGDFTSPAEALASPLVMAGDVVLVMPGTYVGTLTVDKAVELVSAAGSALTVLDGGGSGPVLDLLAGASVSGFTITGGGGPVCAGGVRIESASTVHVTDNVIADNHPTGDMCLPSGGVLIEPGSSAVLEGNDIHSNTSLSTGGLVAGPSSTVDLVRNRIRGNGGSGTIIGGVLFGSSGRLVNNRITANHGTGVGGVYLAGGDGPPPSGAVVDIVNCTIYGNRGSSPEGSVGGLFLDDGGAVTIRNTLIHSNPGSVVGDVVMSPDFSSPPAAGFVDLDYSHVGMLGFGVPMGPHMVPSHLDPMLRAPFIASPTEPSILGNFRPFLDSPDMNAGESADFPLDLAPLDLLGRPRFAGTAVEVGAYEEGHGYHRARMSGRP